MDIERTMAFIVEQQAKFENDIEKINESLTRLNETARLQNEHAERTNTAIRDLVQLARLQSERVDGLERNLSESHARLTRVQMETDRRLADFVAQVSRYLAGGNGRKRRPGAPGTK